MPRYVSLVLPLMLVAQSAFGQPPPGALREQVEGTVGIHQSTQKQEDVWAREKAELKARYKASPARCHEMEREKTVLERQKNALEAQVAELERRIRESVRLQEGLSSTTDETLLRLDQSVETDLPFLPQERAARLASLTETLALTDLSQAEKLRRLLEALQVECEYGSTIETYQQKIDVEGSPVFADIFRLGRISIFWQTPDGTRVGEYDRVNDRWVELPSKYRRSIRAAVEMARKQRPVELLQLPVGRIEP